MAILLIMTSLSALGEAVERAPIGRHYPVFIYEKNENPSNFMLAYVKLDDSCRIRTSGGRPTFDYYWLLEGKRYKPVHPLIRKGIAKRVSVGPLSPDKRKFELRFQDVPDIDPKLRGETVSISASGVKGACRARAEFRDLKLISIFSHSRKTMWPPFRKVEWIRLNGEKGSHTFGEFTTL